MSKKLRNRPAYNRFVFSVLRTIRGMSPQEIAAKTGLSAQTIRNIRKGPAHGGTRYPRFETLEDILAINQKRFFIGDEGDEIMVSRAIEPEAEELPSDKKKAKKRVKKSSAQVYDFTRALRRKI